MSEVYKTIRKISGKAETPSKNPGKMLDGSEPDNDEALFKDCAKYFASLLINEKSSSDIPLGDAEEYLDISETDFSIAKLLEVIASIKTG